MFVGIDRASKYTYVEIYDAITIANSCKFLNNLIQDFPFKIEKILTDNGSQFTYELLAEHLKPNDKTHPFDQICKIQNIEHRLIKFRHPWTNGQVEITNKIIKKFTTKTYYYEEIDELKKHVMAFLMVYNYQKPLKSLKFKTPYDTILEEYDKYPNLFRRDPTHKITELNM